MNNSNSLLSEVLDRGLRELQRECKDAFLRNFKDEVKALFNKTDDVETIKEEILEILKRYELDNTRRYL